MAEKAADKVQQTIREGTDTARETAGKTAGMARRAGEAASAGYEELWILSQVNIEGIAKASQAMLKGTSDLGSVWASFWNEQLDDGVQAMRSLSECRGWHDALAVQNEFTRSSIERVCSRAAKSAELSAEMMKGSFRPLQESAHKTVEHFPRGAT